ncbi:MULTISPECIES: VCBS repeat-containing protein [unclassified Haladaptatus]|nr:MULTISPECIES: VCBS repeat-containing protein [unclassified Haladaptatus]
MKFRHETIDPRPPCTRLGICLTTDLTGNGLPDVIVGGMGAIKNMKIRGRYSSLPNLAGLKDMVGLKEESIFWYENPGWRRHRLSTSPDLYVFGNALGDVNGDGRLDLVVGQAYRGTKLFWLEQPADPTQPWPEHLIHDKYDKYHDIAVADVDDDGENEIVGLSQESKVIFYYDVPADPTQSPWPEENLHVIAEGLAVEGLVVVDVDGDGETEVVAGPHIFSQPATPGELWHHEEISTGWDYTRAAVADIDDDGDLEIILAEGDSPTYGTHPGRLAILDPPTWEATFIHEDLFCPHSLQVADVDGDGHLDIYVGEMGLGENPNPRHFVFHNQGDGTFEPVVIATGIPTHEAKVVDLNGDGRLDIVGKPYEPERHVDVWYNEREDTAGFADD